ncbi:uncharacterized protein N0V89_009829 [Didymosphaeria variabile]|uniref:Uncharacterized protein n=1 Tax=Didymosphaeria variabile TaxID=1932322 RepID=A0A9W8XEP0_9PLEO|nr:uncharacterized protein N0V89_009829 [Didymosphaeria variabile]KAJ4348455.1 hypothetical protein N0V89_009829 [Didymosphaeria variabile]
MFTGFGRGALTGCGYASKTAGLGEPSEVHPTSGTKLDEQLFYNPTATMSLARGERVYFDLDNGNIEPAGVGQEIDDAPRPALTSAFVGDILERPAREVAHPPVAPSLIANVNGFPAHKKRKPRVSAFKRERFANEDAKPKEAIQRTEDVKKERVHITGARGQEDDEKRQIDQENKKRLANMTNEEIEQEQRELLMSLPSSLVQRLLGRANVADGSNEKDWDVPKDSVPENFEIRENEAITESMKIQKLLGRADVADGSNEEDWDAPKETGSETPVARERESKAVSTKKVAFVEPSPAQSELPTSTDPAVPGAELAEEHSSIHFPRPTQPPDLDPNDRAFLQNLHEKYFPNLAYDPSTLSWMTPIDPADTKSPYHPSHQAFNARDLRFDFKGALLAPSVAREIPVDQGLHHHAEAPEAAGYTIAELAIMGRSSVAAQRCVAFQTLGRVLYRLGRGEFGIERVRRKTDGPVQVVKNPNVEEEEVDEDETEVDMEDAGSAMASGLWKEVESGKVVETLTEEANKSKGHLTSRTFAQEALWNWRRGGGRKRAAV